MARRGRPYVRLMLNAEQRAELQRRVRGGTSCQRDGPRARIILASEDGGSAAAVARRVGAHPRTVERWRDRFRCRGLHDISILQRQCLRDASFRSIEELNTKPR